MTNPREPAVRPTEAASPQGEKGVFKIYSKTNYFNISESKSGKIPNKCKCYACEDSGYEYKNELIIEYNNPLIFTFFTKGLVK